MPSHDYAFSEGPLEVAPDEMLGVPEFSEEALAQKFVGQYGDQLRYVAVWGHWYCWTGGRWEQDSTLYAFDRARAICRQASRDADKTHRQMTLASAKTYSAVTSIARADRTIAATVDQWDVDIWLLNTPRGTVDLRTGSMRTHDPMDYATKQTVASPAGSCPEWLKFLNRIMDGDGERVEYLQRVAGYALTGSTREHVLIFGHGGGANGKSVFVNTLAGVLGDYAKTAPIDLFLDSKSDRHPTELAMLRGARLVTAIETEEGRAWAESKIKALTGGDKISARFMRQDFFEFVPQFLLLIVGNHRPSLRSVDEAIRRRLHLVPFNVTIPVEERDEHLTDKLKVEWPGILAWAIEGCLQWQEIGLAPPEAVKTATEKYLVMEDAVTAWIDECCHRDADAFEAGTDLWQNWKQWAERSNEPPGKRKDLLAALESRNCIEHRTNHARGLKGLRLNRANYTGREGY